MADPESPPVEPGNTPIPATADPTHGTAPHPAASEPTNSPDPMIAAIGDLRTAIAELGETAKLPLTSLPATDQALLGAITDLDSKITQLSAALGKSAKASESTIPAFFGSGLFFMLVGGFILFLAFNTMSSTYAIFSFVLVVLGVAILLFGTGTQSMGEFDSDSTTAARYKLRLAGGAGALAFASASGIVAYSYKMKEAFQIERKYIVVQVKAKGDGTSSFDGYAPPAFSISGSPIPVMRRGDYVIAYIPYVEHEKDKTRAIAYEFRMMDTANRNKALRPIVKDVFTVDIVEAKLDRKDGAFDFPVHTDVKEVDLKSAEVAQETLNTSGTNPDAPPPAQDPRTIPAPALPSASGA